MKKALLGVVFGLFFLGATVADEEHYINLFIGERAAALGGAYTAIADGPEGAYYNPAGLAFAPVSSFSLSTNSFQYKNITYYDIWKDQDPSQTINYQRSSLAFVPNFFGTLQKNGNSTFAFSLSTLDSEAYDQRNRLVLPNANWNTDQVLNTSLNLNSTLQEAGFAFGFLLSPRTSVGVGLFSNYLDKKRIQNDVNQLVGTDYFQTVSSYYRHQRVNVRPVVGAQWAATEKLTLGTSFSVDVPAYSLITNQTTAYASYPAQDGSMVLLQKVVTPDTKLTRTLWGDGLFTTATVKASMGVAYFFSPSLLASVDAYTYVPVKGTEDDGRVLTWNVAAGTEWYASPNFPIRVGLFTNNANTPALVKGEKDQGEHVDLYGVSGSWGYSTPEFDVNVGFSYSMGLGQTQLLDDMTSIQSVSFQQVQVYVSGGYH